MSSLRMAADDLTGALDAGAPFAEALGPLPVVWDLDRAGDSFILDTESRERDSGVLAAALPALAGADVAYKKIDSLLRGRTAEEIALCIGSGRFRSLVVAPAFPDQQRITRGGRQYWRRSIAEPWQAVPLDLGEPPCSLRTVRAADELAGEGAFLCDAGTRAELDAIAAAGARLARPVLWIGTAGLARALAGPSRNRAGGRLELERPLLAVVGSHHPVSLAQVEAWRRRRPDQLVRLTPAQLEDVAPAVGRLRSVLMGDGAAALVIALPDGTGAAVAGPVFTRIFRALGDQITPPRTMIVTGGATLMRLVQALGAGALEVNGELVPGIACSRIMDGRWPGTAVISKSGAFGGPNLLAGLAGL